MKELFGVITRNRPTTLLRDPDGGEKIAVLVRPGSGVILRGMVLYKDSSGFYVPADESKMNTENDLVIANEDVYTGTTISPYIHAIAVSAFRAGRFISGRKRHKIVNWYIDEEENILFDENETLLLAED